MEQYVYDHRRRMFEGTHFLPLVYLIPDMTAEQRGFADFPRDPYIVATEDEWLKVYHSKQFQIKLLDTWALMMWASLGIKGGIDNYSINNPINRMVCDLGMWAWLLNELGVNIDFLAAFPHGEEIPFPTMDEAEEYCNGFANAFWNHPYLKMREVWEIVKTHRAHGDYSGMPSHAKVDFYRHYYHTRAQTKVEPIVSGHNEDGEEIIVHAPYTPSGFAEVETRLWFDGFFEAVKRERPTNYCAVRAGLHAGGNCGAVGICQPQRRKQAGENYPQINPVPRRRLLYPLPFSYRTFWANGDFTVEFRHWLWHNIQ